MLRPRVLLCVGEDPADCGVSPAEHAYRGFTARIQGDVLVLTTPFGSTAMEALLWELLRPGVVERVVLAGTAGALGGFRGRQGTAYAVGSARPAYQAFDVHEKATYAPSWNPGLEEVSSVSTDRFYGFSTLAEADYPAEPGLLETWQQLGSSDAIVEMEVAAFYHFCQSFGAPNLQYLAIKVVANDVADLDSLPAGAAKAMAIALDAAWRALEA